MSLTPASTDKNREAELARKKDDPVSFGVDIRMQKNLKNAELPTPPNGGLVAAATDNTVKEEAPKSAEEQAAEWAADAVKGKKLIAKNIEGALPEKDSEFYAIAFEALLTASVEAGREDLVEALNGLKSK